MTHVRSDGPPRADGRRVLVFGASGFIGRRIVRAFSDAGAEVHAAGRDRGRIGEAVRSAGAGCTAWECDLLLPGAGAALVRRLAPDLVVNAAGYGVLPSERDPALLDRFGSGVPAELADAVAAGRGAGSLPALIHIGSAAEYGSAGGDLREDGPACPASPYGRSKLAGTLAVAARSRDRGLAAVVARAFTVYGPGEPAGRLLPTLLAARTAGTPVGLTAGTQRRDFTYVGDVAEAILRIASAPRSADPVVNVASGRLLTVREFAVEAARTLGIPESHLRFGTADARREEMDHDPVSNAKLLALVGWTPRTSVADGVARTLRATMPGGGRP